MPPRRGYILLIILVMIIMAGLLATRLARYSLALAMDAAKVQEDLQCRWGAISCRQVVLNRAEILFRKQQLGLSESETLSPRMGTSICLGGLTFRLFLSDEQAKLNLNTVFSEKQLRGVDRVLYDMTNSARGVLSTDLNPHPDAVSHKTYPLAFDSWGQVFSYERSRGGGTSDALPRAVMEATVSVTCWGDGRLNVLRADPLILHRACRLIVSPEAARRFLESRTAHPHWPLDRLLDGTDLNHKERRDLRRWLTDRSTCHSLWTIIDNGHRSRVHLDVCQSLGQGGNPQIATFYW